MTHSSDTKIAAKFLPITKSRILAQYYVNNFQNLVKDIEDIWFKEWRCLFAGKLMNGGEQDLSEKLDALLLNCQMYVSELTVGEIIIIVYLQ